MSYLTLDDEEENLLLFNKKPMDMFGEEPDHDFYANRRKIKRPKKKGAISSAFGIDVDALEEENYQITKSSSSCHID